MQHKSDHNKNLKRIMFRSKNKNYPILSKVKREDVNKDLPHDNDGMKRHISGGKIVINER